MEPTGPWYHPGRFLTPHLPLFFHSSFSLVPHPFLPHSLGISTASEHDTIVVDKSLGAQHTKVSPHMIHMWSKVQWSIIVKEESSAFETRFVLESLSSYTGGTQRILIDGVRSHFQSRIEVDSVIGVSQGTLCQY